MLNLMEFVWFYFRKNLFEIFDCETQMNLGIHSHLPLPISTHPACVGETVS